jgi:hypothetical protein
MLFKINRREIIEIFSLSMLLIKLFEILIIKNRKRRERNYSTII